MGITMENKIEELTKTLDNLKVEKRVLENKKEETFEKMKQNGIDTEDITEIEEELDNLLNKSKELNEEAKGLLEDTEAKLLEIQKKVENE